MHLPFRHKNQVVSTLVTSCTQQLYTPDLPNLCQINKYIHYPSSFYIEINTTLDIIYFALQATDFFLIFES